ncbi:carboxypeptidase regulatory-like domain-containing protein [Edaphobacter sp. HDX4]|uniref:tetratricopeptide repeat protein n=1 Tax=Edaphobacter sp. HDX4 TaxID=2794064 RepID=UPI002FE56CB7
MKAVSIRGVVNEANGKPVPDALISLQPSGLVTRTDAHGSFALVNVRPGKYSLHAEKADEHASREVSTDDQVAQITLVLAPNAARTESMEFADKPDFTVAGITDWTAVGGHGSDASLRTSETLARETATLRPAEAVPAPTGDRETELRTTAAASPRSFAANRELGKFCLQNRDYREAVLPLETAFRIDPADKSNEYDLAFAYKEAGDLKRSQEHIRHLLAEENTAELHRLAGDVDEAMGDALSAEREYETAVHLDPSELNQFTWGAELLLHRAIWPAAEVFRKGIAAYPKSPRMLSALGVARFASAQYEEAAQHLCEAAELNPQDPAPYTFLGEIEIASPAPLGCAEQKLARFTQTQPDNARAKYYYAMAILKRQGVPANTADIEYARSLLLKATELDPKLGEAYLQMGILSMDRKEYRQSIDLFTKAVEANPQLGDAHYRRGVSYQRLGLAVQAKEEFEQHDAIERAQAQAVEQKRTRVKQFMVVLQGQSADAK